MLKSIIKKGNYNLEFNKRWKYEYNLFFANYVSKIENNVSGFN